MEILTDICYLCGQPLDENTDKDHVPPRQFYSKEIRITNNLNLLTLLTHRTCNHSYQSDEEYFIHTLGPIVRETFAGNSISGELLGQYRDGRNIPLSRKVLSEFQKFPSGLYLPNRKIVKQFDPNRVWRVIWKMTRGLFMHEYKTFLPEDTPRQFKIMSPGEKPPDEFFLLPDYPIRGRYRGVFDYRYRKFKEINDLHLWAMLFWDKIITLVYFHDPCCQCNTCLCK